MSFLCLLGNQAGRGWWPGPRGAHRTEAAASGGQRPSVRLPGCSWDGGGISVPRSSCLATAEQGAGGWAAWPRPCLGLPLESTYHPQGGSGKWCSAALLNPLLWHWAGPTGQPGQGCLDPRPYHPQSLREVGGALGLCSHLSLVGRLSGTLRPCQAGCSLTCSHGLTRQVSEVHLGGQQWR